MDITLPILILAIPISMFLILGIGGVKMSRKMAGVLGILGMGTTMALAYTVAFTYFFSGDSAFIVDGIRQQLQVFDVTWLAFTEKLVVSIGFLLDPISAMMLVVITTISFMVHLYSWGYMEHEPGFQRYYAFLSLFSFSMLGLVVATNIFQMYIFWELVGVSSYLLIGFFYKLPSAVFLYQYLQFRRFDERSGIGSRFYRWSHVYGCLSSDLGFGSHLCRWYG